MINRQSTTTMTQAVRLLGRVCVRVPVMYVGALITSLNAGKDFAHRWKGSDG